MSSRLVLLAAAALLAVSLGACGKRGTLERPDPMWGAPASADADADAAADEGVNDDSDEGNPDKTRPYSTSKPLDPAQTNVPVREAPVGGPSDPYGRPNGGSPG